MVNHSLLDDSEKVKGMDSAGMSELLRDFPEQIEDAIGIGEALEIPRSLGRGVEKIVFAGLGGSAIGGDVIRSLMASDSCMPIWVFRHYELPPFVDSKTLCIFSSYSGNTEETIAAFRGALKRGLKKLIVITSGGELACLAEKASLPWIQLPKGFPPRSALGYSVFPILKLFSNLKLWRWDALAAEETLSLLKKLGEKKFTPEISFMSNPAKKLAHALWRRLVVIYAGTELLDSAALRFRNQIEENAKALASHHLIPEMNHNEILGWQFPVSLIRHCACVFLKDRMDHPRIQLRMKITRGFISGRKGVCIEEIHSEGKSRLARLFSAIYFGDWVSLYLALLYRIDPTPVAVIESLKKQLARVPFGQ